MGVGSTFVVLCCMYVCFSVVLTFPLELKHIRLAVLVANSSCSPPFYDPFHKKAAAAATKTTCTYNFIYFQSCVCRFFIQGFKPNDSQTPSSGRISGAHLQLVRFVGLFSLSPIKLARCV